MLDLQTKTMPMTALPYPLQPSSLRRHLRQFWLLMRMILAEFREIWAFHAFFSLMLPLGFIYFLLVTGGEADMDRAVFLLGGSVTASIIFGPTFMTIGRIGYQRETREFEYWVALPITKMSLLLAIICVALLFAIPGLVGVFAIGSYLLDFPIWRGLLILPLLPLSAFPLATIGAFLGTIAKDGLTSNLYGNIMLTAVNFMSPIWIEMDELPTVLRWLAYVNPATYSADAFRAVLGGDFGIRLAINVAILIGVAIVFTAIVHRRLDWRVS